MSYSWNDSSWIVGGTPIARRNRLFVSNESYQKKASPLRTERAFIDLIVVCPNRYMELEPAGKIIHYTGVVLFIGSGIFFLYVAPVGLVHSDIYLWIGIFSLAAGFIVLLMLYFRPQWLGKTVQ